MTTFSLDDTVVVVDPDNDEESCTLVIVRVSNDDVFGTEYLLRFPDGYEAWYWEDEIAYPEEEAEE